MNPSVSTGHVAEFRRGWTIVFVSIIGIACGLSAISIYSIGAFTKPLSDAYGWSRAEVQGIYTFMLLGNLIAAPALGWIIDRYGVRRITLFSILASALGLAALGLFTNSLWGMYAVAFVTSVVGIATVPITWTRVIITWFQKNRGLALGLTLAGSGLSATFLPVYVTWLIDEFGWRYAYVGIAALPALIALPAAYFLLKDHNPYEQNTPDLAVEKTAQDTGIDLKQACSDYRFWIIIFVFVVIGGNISGLITHLIPILTDRGMNPTVAAQMAGTIGVAVIGGRVVTGFLLDRFWAPSRWRGCFGTAGTFMPHSCRCGEWPGGNDRRRHFHRHCSRRRVRFYVVPREPILWPAALRHAVRGHIHSIHISCGRFRSAVRSVVR